MKHLKEITKEKAEKLLEIKIPVYRVFEDGSSSNINNMLYNFIYPKHRFAIEIEDWVFEYRVTTAKNLIAADIKAQIFNPVKVGGFKEIPNYEKYINSTSNYFSINNTLEYSIVESLDLWVKTEEFKYIT